MPMLTADVELSMAYGSKSGAKRVFQAAVCIRSHPPTPPHPIPPHPTPTLPTPPHPTLFLAARRRPVRTGGARRQGCPRGLKAGNARPSLSSRCLPAGRAGGRAGGRKKGHCSTHGRAGGRVGGCGECVARALRRVGAGSGRCAVGVRPVRRRGTRAVMHTVLIAAGREHRAVGVRPVRRERDRLRPRAAHLRPHPPQAVLVRPIAAG